MKSVLTTLSGDELSKLRDELGRIKAAFSMMEFDDEDVDEKKGIKVQHEPFSFQNHVNRLPFPVRWSSLPLLLCAIPRPGWLRV